jgi:ABC-type multidrug transport system fused ATPase/permease subunit
MQRIIREEFKGCIHHSWGSLGAYIRDFDRIAVLDEGRHVDYRNPDELLSDLNSRFGALWD